MSDYDWLVYRNQRRTDIRMSMVILGIATIAFYIGSIQGQFSSQVNLVITGFMASRIVTIIEFVITSRRIRKRLGLVSPKSILNEFPPVHGLSHH